MSKNKKNKNSSSSKQTNSNPRSSKIKIPFYIFLFLVFLFSLSLEFVDSYFQILLSKKIAYFTLVIVIIPILVATTAKDESKDKVVPKNATFFNRLTIGARNLCFRIYDNTASLFVFFVAGTICLGSILASCHICGYTLIMAQTVFDNVVEPVIDNNREVNALTIDDIDDIDNTENYLEIDYLKLSEPNKLMILSEYDKANLYFNNSSYMITDWTNQEDINNTVYNYIIHLQSQEKPNLFNNAPNKIKDHIYYLSNIEKFLTTSDELDYVIENRYNYYQDYPMEKLAQLIAENYAKYGLAYYNINGYQETMEYYFGNSIIWYNEALCYNNNYETVKYLLEHIAIRYHDIAASLSDSMQKQQASALSQAYYYWTENINSFIIY